MGRTHKKGDVRTIGFGLIIRGLHQGGLKRRKRFPSQKQWGEVVSDKSFETCWRLWNRNRKGRGEIEITKTATNKNTWGYKERDCF
jgi:hypothetical protein